MGKLCGTSGLPAVQPKKGNKRGTLSHVLLRTMTMQRLGEEESANTIERLKGLVPESEYEFMRS